MLWRPGSGRHAACLAVTPLRDCRKFGPCQVFLANASSRRARMIAWSLIRSSRESEIGFYRNSTLVPYRGGSRGLIEDHGEADASAGKLLLDHRGGGLLVSLVYNKVELHHTLADIVGVGAGVDGHRRLNGNLRGQFAVDKG